MTQEIAASDQIDTRVLSDRPQSRSALAFAIGFGVAGVLTAIAVALMLSGEGLATGASPLIFTLLSIALVVALGLGGILTHRLMRVARAWASAATGARLHVRFVTLFSLAALAPALIVAAFFGLTFTQGVERWFGVRVESTIENAADVGRAYVDLASGNLRDEVQAMAEDMNNAAQGLTQDPNLYRTFLAAQAERRQLTSAYVITHNGVVLSRAERAGAQGYEPPSTEAFSAANAGAVSVLFDQPDDRVRALYKLSAYPDAYLSVTREVAPGMVTKLRNFDQAVDDYRNAQKQRGSIRVLFGFAYFLTALLVLFGAVWVGLTSATRVAEPIGRLADAARRVAAGDLKARVAPSAERDEVDALAGAFNSMTVQLETQRRDLVTAQEDAETRSRFIEAVLGGVSAGVIGLDQNGRISAANRSAAQLIGLADQTLSGRRMIDVAPEFAELLNQAAPTEETPAQRIDIVRENFSANLSVRMSPDAEGGLVLTFDDMTKLIAAQRQEAWKDVARRIAHEIKNPLTPIQLSADRLKRKFAPEITSDQDTFIKCTDTILRQVADIGRMVDEFSSFARMPTPQMAFTDMADVAQSVVFAQRISFPDIRVEGEGIATPIGLVCDGRLIGQALLNLVKNAAESVQARRVRDGEPKDGFVILRLRDLEYGVQFEVIDNGLGFPAQNRERLIEPYVTTRVKGHGLGLAIVARVVEDHGGLIELDDAPGAGPGAVVRFVLPKRVEEPTEPVAEHGEGAT